MRTTLIALSGLFVAQIALAVWLNLSSGGLAGQTPGTPLLAFEADAVERLTISDADGQSVTLARADEGWRLPDAGDFPADTAKVDGLLADLASAEQGAAIATSDTAAERFRVSDDAYERKIVLERESGDPATVYLGTSQGTRQVHVRRADQDGVHRIAFSTWRAPADRADWLDKTALQIDPAEIASLKWNGIMLEQVASESNGSESEDQGETDANAVGTTTWQATGTSVTDPPADAVNALTDQLSRIRINGLVPQEDSDAYQTAALALDIVLEDGTTRTYTLLKGGDDTSYAVRSSTLPGLMTVSASTAEAIVEAAADPALTGAETPPEESSPADNSEATPQENASADAAQSAGPSEDTPQQ